MIFFLEIQVTVNSVDFFLTKKTGNTIHGDNTIDGDTIDGGEYLTSWSPLFDKRFIPTAPLVARFWLWTAIVKPTEIVEPNGTD